MIKKWSDISGWCNSANLYEEIVNLAEDNSIFVEIGAWLGMSTALMATLIKKSNKKIVFYTIDTFEGSASYPPQIDYVKENGGNIFHLFYKNLQELDLLNYMNPIIQNSFDAIKFIPKEIDFLFIDGDHKYEFIFNELNLYWPLIKKGGIISGDDINHNDVEKATKDFFSKISLSVQIHNVDKNCWYVKKL